MNHLEWKNDENKHWGELVEHLGLILLGTEREQIKIARKS